MMSFITLKEEESFQSHVRRFEPILDKMVDVLYEKTGRRISNMEAWAYVAWASAVFTERLVSSLPPEMREVVAELLMATSKDCMDRFKAYLGMSFPAPTGHRFDTPAELTSMINEVHEPEQAQVKSDYVPSGYL